MATEPMHDDRDARRAFGREALEWMLDYLERFDDAPILQAASPEEVAGAFNEPLPEEGQGFERLLLEFKEKVVRYATHLQNPGNFAYIPNSTDFVGVIADALASTLNQNVSLWRGGPSAAALERKVVEWIRDLIGFSAQGYGTLVSGGSMANLIGLALARDRVGAGEDLVFYLSPEIHSSIHRGLAFLGLSKKSVHLVKTDAGFRMNPAALAEAIAWDREKGRKPAAVVASAGTVSSGAVDPLEALSDVCREEGLSLHVDGAYGALAAMAPSGGWMRAGLARADSLSLDPHKWLFVPIDASVLLVRDPERLRRAFSLFPEYLKVRGPESEREVLHPMESTIELTRRFRALKIWMTLKKWGARVLRERIESHLLLARRLGDWVEATPGFERLAPVDTSIVCFRHVPGGAEGVPAVEREKLLESINQEILERINGAGEFFLSHCRLNGVFALRVCITNLRTTEEQVTGLWSALRTVAGAVGEERGL
jgi:aromatic-L-amino-acid decarboxylase